MTRTSLLLAFTFLAGACGGADTAPTGPSTTEATAPDEKSEDKIQMSASPAPAAKKKEAAPPAAQPKPAEPTPAAPATPATPTPN